MFSLVGFTALEKGQEYGKVKAIWERLKVYEILGSGIDLLLTTSFRVLRIVKTIADKQR